MAKINFSIYPHWQFLLENFSHREAFSFFGPYAGANIQPYRKDDNTFIISMPLVPTNTNYVGTHFGGSLYSMCDPWFMFLLIDKLGEDYIVWDKSATIEFVKPGKGTVKAEFHINDEEIEEIKSIIAEKRKTTREYRVDVSDENNDIVARVTKILYIRHFIRRK